MQRREPLQELPLEQQFLPSNANLPANPIRGSKRPHSPGDRNLFSPAKRRIFESEGLLFPSKSRKTPILSPSSKLLSPSRFSDVLTGHASPARVLDFGLPKNSGGDPVKPFMVDHCALDATPPPKPPTKSPAPSPELKPRSVRILRNHDALDALSDSNESSESASPPPSSYPRSNPVFVPRLLPPQPDPTSVHYPGFVVYQDPHLVVFSPSTLDEEISSEVDMENDKPKENMPPRKVKKTLIIPSVSVKNGLSVKKLSSMNDTSRSRMVGKATFLSPSTSGAIVGVSSPPSRLQGTRSLRQAMMDELEDADD